MAEVRPSIYIVRLPDGVQSPSATVTVAPSALQPIKMNSNEHSINHCSYNLYIKLPTCIFKYKFARPSKERPNITQAHGKAARSLVMQEFYVLFNS